MLNEVGNESESNARMANNVGIGKGRYMKRVESCYTERLSAGYIPKDLGTGIFDKVVSEHEPSVPHATNIGSVIIMIKRQVILYLCTPTRRHTRAWLGQ